MPPPLVLGIGNAQRGDDALGLAVAERLRTRLGERLAGLARLRCASGEATGLLTAWQHEPSVIVIDAMAGEAGQGRDEVLRLDATAGPLPALRESTSTHGLGLAEAIELARSLGCLPPRLVVFAVPGRCFERGAALSVAARSALPRAVDAVMAELEAIAREAA